MAKENKLFGESCSWGKKKMSYSRLSVNNVKSKNWMTYLLQGDFLYLTWGCSWYYGLIDWNCRWNDFR
jgi:hypothetical protein